MPYAHTKDHLSGREAKLFRNNKSQAVRIPADFEMPGDRVMIHSNSSQPVRS